MADIIVAPGGSDGGTGSAGSPFLTPNHAIGLATPGDNILLRVGTYPRRVYFNAKNGTSGAPITIKPWPGETVTIAGEAGLLNCILVNDSDYIIIDGLRIIYNYALTLPDSKMAWVRFQGTSNHSQIRNFYIRRDWVDSSGNPRNAQQEFNSGRREVGVSVGANCNDITIGNTNATRGGDSEIIGINKCVQFTDYITNCQVKGINCHGYMQQGVDFQALDLTREAGILVDNCIFDGSINEDGIQSHNTPGDTGTRTIRGIRVNNCEIRNNAENAVDMKNADSWTIENCIIHGIWGSSGGQFGVPESGNLPNRRSMHAMIVGGNESGYNIIQRNNIFYDNPSATTLQQGWTIYNNTVIWCQRDYTGAGSTYDDTAQQFPYFGGVVPTDNVITTTGSGVFTKMGIKNNLFANLSSAGVCLRSGLGDVDSDYNRFANMTGKVGADCDAAPYIRKSLAAWRTWMAGQGWATDAEAHSAELANVAACLYVDVPEHPTGDYANFDFGLQATSPLLSAGGHLTRVTGAVTSSLNVTFQNANYFTDGYGRAGEGDTVYIEGAGARQITNVNYTTNVVTFATAVTAANLARVWWGNAATANIGVTTAAAAPPPPPTSGGSVTTTRVAAQTTPGNQLFTLPVDTGFAALEIRCMPVTADNIAVNGLSVSHGFFVLASQQFSTTIRSTNAVSPADTDRRNSNTDCIILLNNTSNALAVRGAGVSVVGATFTLNWITPPPVGYFVEIDTLPSTAASVVTVAIPQVINTATVVSVAHPWNHARSLGEGKDLNTGYINARFTRGYATKLSGVLNQNAFGWYSWNAQNPTSISDQIILNRFAGHVTNIGTTLWSVELSNPTGNNINVITRDGTPTDPDNIGILFLNTDAPIWTGTIGILTGAGVKNFTEPNFPVAAVNLLTTLATADGEGFSDNLASSFGTATLTADANYSTSLTDRDNVATTDTQSLSHAVPLDLRQFDGGDGLLATSWASIVNGFSMTLASAIGARALAVAWGESGTAIYTLVATDLTGGTPVLDTPTFGQTHVLIATDLVTPTPVLDTPTFGQTHILVATDLIVAPILDIPTFGQVHTLSAIDLTATPVLDTPSIAAVGTLLATDLIGGTPVLDTPVFGQTHVLVATDLTATPILDTPALVQAYALIATDLIAGTPVLDSPTLAQTYVLTTADLIVTPVLDAPILVQTHILQASDMNAGTPVLDSPTFHLDIAAGAVIALFRVRKPKIIFESGEQ